MNQHNLKFSTQYSYRLKILLLGPKQSGKSSLIYTYLHQCGPAHKITSQQTDAVIKKIKYIKSNKNQSQTQHYECNVHLWDTTAQQSLEILNTTLFKRVNAIILVFDVNQITSFEKMKKMWDSITRPEKAEVILIGNNKKIINEDHLKKQKKRFEQDTKMKRSIVIQENQFSEKKSRKRQFQGMTPQRQNQQYRQILDKIQQFIASHNDVTYYQISVHDPKQVKLVFQQLLATLMGNIQSEKISLQSVIIRDIRGNIKLRKFDYKTYQYFQKRYNKCC